MCKEFNYTQFTRSLASKSSLVKKKNVYKKSSCPRYGTSKSVEKRAMNKEPNKLAVSHTLKMLWEDWKYTSGNLASLKFNI